MFTNTFKLKYIYFIASLSIGCNSDQEKNLTLIEKPQFQIPLQGKGRNTLKKFTELFDSLKIISLKTPDSVFISSISKVILFRNQIFVLDKKFSSLSCFDNNGFFLKQYGQIGLRNDEFMKIQDFDIDKSNNEIVIYSNENQSLYYYSLQKASFIKRKYIGLYAEAISVLPDKQILLYMNYKINNKLYGLNSVHLDSTTEVKNRYFPFDPKHSSIGWGFTGFMSMSNDKIFLSTAFDETVHIYKNGNFIPFCVININSEYIEANKVNLNKLYASNKILDSAATFLGTEFFVSDDYIVFGYQIDRRVKVAVYRIKDKSIQTMSAKNSNDPFVILAGKPLTMNHNNTIVFSISPDNILSLKEKKPEIFANLPISVKEKFDNTTSTSNFYLLFATLKK